MRGETKSRVAMSLLASPSLDEADDVELSGRQRRPATGRSFAFAAPALCVGYRLVGCQCGTLGPGGLEVCVPHGITKCRNDGLVSALIDLEADFAGALPDGLCGAEEPDPFRVTAGLGGQTCQAFENVRNA